MIARKSAPPGEEKKRRTERILLRVPIEVNGTGADGKPFTEKTYTLVVNRHGARVRLKRAVRPNDQVTITNPRTKMACPFRIVAKATDLLSEGPEWGVECLEPDVNFWGINFPGKTSSSVAEELIDALLECSKCRSRELAQLALADYRTLVSQSALSRQCEKCGAATDWVFAFVEAEAEEAVPNQPTQTTSAPESETGAERRRAKRVTVKLPVRIRLADQREEVARTENLSTTGVCFASTLAMNEGERIRLTVGYSPGSNEAEITARVVWRRRIDGTNRALYGVRLEQV